MDEAGGDGVIRFCPECGRVFRNLRGLRTHYSQAHRECGPLLLPLPLEDDTYERLMSCKTALLALLDERHERWLKRKNDEEIKRQKENEDMQNLINEILK